MWNPESKSPYTGSATLLGFLVGFGITLALSTCSPLPSHAEVSYGFRVPGVTGLTKTDFDPVLCQDTVDNEVDSSAVTLLSNGENYQWSGLPDVTSGSGTTYLLLWDYDGLRYTYTWPDTTRTPQAVINRVSYRVTTNPLDIVGGSTLPSASLTINGLSSDPTSGTATFTLWNSSRTIVLPAVSASLSDVDQASDGTWSVSLTHDWTTAETTTLAGTTGDFKTYYGRFTLTVGTDVLSYPPAPGNLQVRVYP